MDAKTILIIFFIAGVALITMFSKNKKKSSHAKKSNNNDTRAITEGAYIKQKAMTETEYKFWGILCQALPDFFVFPQISTLAIIKAKRKENYFGAHNKISQTRIDFVVFTSNINMEVIALIELDDYTHDSEEQKERDKIRDSITKQVGYKTIRFDCRKHANITPQQLRETILS